MDVIIKRHKSPETLRLIEKRQEITKCGNLRFKFDSHLNQKVWALKQQDRRGRDEVETIILELMFIKREKKQITPVGISSSTNQGQARVQNGNVRNLPKLCGGPRKVKCHA